MDDSFLVILYRGVVKNGYFVVRLTVRVASPKAEPEVFFGLN